MNKSRPSYYSPLLVLTFFLGLFASCSIEKQISKSAKSTVLSAAPFQTAHIGISIYDPSSDQYLYNYQGDKYFVPASNTKIPTCYVAMKYLKDSLAGMNVLQKENTLYLFPTGDPTFMHRDFPNQPVLSYLKNNRASRLILIDTIWREQALGSGWSWNDYDQEYMAERSSMPINGNIIEITGIRDSLKTFPKFDIAFQSEGMNEISAIDRELGSNRFSISFKGEKKRTLRIPFSTENGQANKRMLENILQREFHLPNPEFDNDLQSSRSIVIHSQPTDSMLKPMMHRSDNFFAEQSLLMVSNEKLGYMSDSRIIDTILKTDFKDLPQKPRWVDGSGLSRYNLFTPQDFVAILNKMQSEFPMARIKEIFPTGGEGTISSYYKADSGYIYAKTGTLSGVVAFSGYLFTKKGKLLIFSTLVNNHQATATEIRRAIEKFLQGIRNKY